MRLVVTTLLFAVLLTLTACSEEPVREIDKRPNTPAAVANAIRERLVADGYVIEPVPSPEGAPQWWHLPRHAFQVQVDFAAPNAFTLGVYVFGSPAKAALFAKRVAAASSCTTCRSCLVGRVFYSATGAAANATVPVGRFDRIIALASANSVRRLDSMCKAA
jgi:hypothetical protein